MVVGVLQVELHIPGSGSLKTKRRVLRSLKDRIRNGFNASVSEVSAHDLWQRAVLGIVCVGSDRSYVSGMLNRIRDLVEQQDAAELIDMKLEML